MVIVIVVVIAVALAPVQVEFEERGRVGDLVSDGEVVLPVGLEGLQSLG
ncbi:hypothetical protein [Methylibium sp.]